MVQRALVSRMANENDTAPRFVWRSTDDSVRNGTISLLAIAEIPVALFLYFYIIPQWFGYWTPVIISAIAAPLLLRRSGSGNGNGNGSGSGSDSDSDSGSGSGSGSGNGSGSGSGSGSGNGNGSGSGSGSFYGPLASFSL